MSSRSRRKLGPVGTGSLNAYMAFASNQATASPATLMRPSKRREGRPAGRLGGERRHRASSEAERGVKRRAFPTDCLPTIGIFGAGQKSG